MRWIIRFVFLLVTLAVLGIGALFLIPADRIIAIVGDKFHAATGRTLAISGKVSPSIYPVLGLYAEGVEIGNPAWVEDGPMLRAEKLNVGIALTGLFSKNIQVERLILTNPEIVLVKGTNGVTSWDFGASDGTSEQGQGLASFSLNKAEFIGGSVLYRDLTNNTEFQAENMNLSLRLPSMTQIASLEGQVGVNGITFDIQTEITGLGPLMEGGSQPADLELNWDGGTVGFIGLLGLFPMGASGEISADTSDLGPLMSLIGQSAPDLPIGLGRDRLSATGSMAMDAAGAIHLSKMDFIFDDNRLAGAVDILPGADRPMISARLQGGSLDVSGLTEGGGGGENTAGWSQSTIDVSALHSIDADIALTLAGLDLGILTLGSTNIHAGLSAGRLVLDLRNVAAYGGSFSGEYVVNGRGGLSMGGDLTASNVQINPLLSEFAGFDRLDGLGTAHLKFLISGNNMNTLMNSLSGSGSLTLGQGAILGLDIGGMIANLDTSYQGEGQKTVYDSVTATFTMDAGIVRNEDLIMKASFGELTGAGTAGVGQQVLDYTIIPRVLYSDAEPDGLRVPLVVSGSWNDPKFNLDLEALAEQELSDELEVLEERATEAVTEAITDALGIELPQGGGADGEPPATLEDQLKNEVANQLLNLLGNGN